MQNMITPPTSPARRLSAPDSQLTKRITACHIYRLLALLLFVLARGGARAQAEQFRGYMRQCREELAKRLCDRVYAENDSRSKHWMLFSKRKFMGKEML